MYSLIKGFVIDMCYVRIQQSRFDIESVGGTRQKAFLKMEFDPSEPKDIFYIFRGHNVAVDPYTRSMNF